MAALNHPNLVAIYDVGWADEQAGQTPYLVMELVPGGTLAQRVAAGGPLDPPAVVDIVDGLASALATLHEGGLVHRDVKPQNVLLSPTGPKLGDLGIVRVEEPSDPDAGALTASGATPGTLRFLAPEAIFGQGAGPKADAFALAMVAFEALTGQSPRPAATLGDLVQGAWQVPVPASEARPDLGTSFDAAFAGGLDLDPNRRLDPKSFAAAMWEALTAWALQPRTAAASPAPGTAPLGAAAPATAIPEPEPEPGTAVAATVLDVGGPAATEASAPNPAEPPGPVAAETRSPDPAEATEPALTEPVMSGVARPNPLAFRPEDATPVLGGRAGEPSDLTSSPSPGDPVSRVLARLGTVTLVMGAVVVGLLLLRPGSTPSASEPTASASGAATASGPGSSPGPSGTDPAGAAAREALDAVVAAIERARGGRDGLKGGDANELMDLADEVGRALAVGDYAAARSATDRLAERADKLDNELDKDRRDSLQRAIDELEAAISPA